MLNCSDIDNAVSQLQHTVTRVDWGIVVASTLLLTLSATLLVFGERLVRPLSAIVGGLGGAAAVFVLSALFDPPLDCEVRLIAASVGAILAAIIALCIFKTGMFILGAAGFGAVTHLVYDALPLPPPDPSFALLGRSGYYYIIMFVSVVLGGILSYLQRKQFIRITSSLIGGGLLVLTVYIITDASGHPLPGLAAIGILVASTLCGIGAQHMLAKRRTRLSEKKREIPMGRVVE